MPLLSVMGSSSNLTCERRVRGGLRSGCEAKTRVRYEDYECCRSGVRQPAGFIAMAGSNVGMTSLALRCTVFRSELPLELERRLFREVEMEPASAICRLMMDATPEVLHAEKNDLTDA